MFFLVSRAFVSPVLLLVAEVGALQGISAPDVNIVIDASGQVENIFESASREPAATQSSFTGGLSDLKQVSIQAGGLTNHSASHRKGVGTVVDASGHTEMLFDTTSKKTVAKQDSIGGLDNAILDPERTIHGDKPTSGSSSRVYSDRDLLSSRGRFDSSWPRWVKKAAKKVKAKTAEKRQKLKNKIKGAVDKAKNEMHDIVKTHVKAVAKTALKHGPKLILGAATSLATGNPGPFFSATKTAFQDISAEAKDSVESIRTEVKAGAMAFRNEGSSALANEIDALNDAIQTTKAKFKDGKMDIDGAMQMVMSEAVIADVKALNMLEGNMGETLQGVAEINDIQGNTMAKVSEVQADAIAAVENKTKKT